MKTINAITTSTLDTNDIDSAILAIMNEHDCSFIEAYTIAEFDLDSREEAQQYIARSVTYNNLIKSGFSYEMAFDIVYNQHNQNSVYAYSYMTEDEKELALFGKHITKE